MDFSIEKLKKTALAFQAKMKRQKNQSAGEDDDTDLDQPDESPGKVKLNGGEHKTVRGIKRKAIGGLFLVFFVAFGAAYLMNRGDDNAARPKTAPLPASTQKESNEAKNGANKEQSYADLAALDQRNRANGPNGMNRANASPNPNMSGQQQQQQSQPVQARPTPAPSSVSSSVPAASIPTPSVSAPAAPVRAASSDASSAAAAERAAEEKRQQDMQKRFSSAIAFALTGQTGSTGTETASAAGASAQPAGTNGSGSSVMPTSAQGGSGYSLLGASNTVQNAAGNDASLSPYVIQAGTMIPAMLFTGIDTDAPGQVVAQVSADVYDSLTHTNLLIPAGSRIIGSYGDTGMGGGPSSSATSNGRINVTFSTVIMPSGQAFDIGQSMVAVDGGGYNGILGKVHRHNSRAFGAGIVSSAFAALGALASGNTNSSDSYSGGQLAMQGAMANLVNSTSRIFDRGSNIQPTVTVEPGHMFQLFVSQPISFGSSL